MRSGAEPRPHEPGLPSRGEARPRGGEWHERQRPCSWTGAPLRHDPSAVAVPPQSGVTEQTVPVPRGRRSRTRRVQRRGEAQANPVTCTSDLEQLKQERREAIHSAAATSASPLASESDTELSQPASDRPVTPDRLSELGLARSPPVTPAMADELF
ncbi:hypothetical protein NDU88_004723 [Pleurodeles waltl]|uniref:Uncharacterized protein n=1 Tax=Pleurodeles waltl TaxID=8319 RepID=A0AAV7SJL8_PLEWA|nr:hypothetical protein NDU88_004723 [Pleurodeles waltl]